MLMNEIRYFVLPSILHTGKYITGIRLITTIAVTSANWASAATKNPDRTLGKSRSALMRGECVNPCFQFSPTRVQPCQILAFSSRQFVFNPAMISNQFFDPPSSPPTTPIHSILNSLVASRHPAAPFQKPVQQPLPVLDGSLQPQADDILDPEWKRGQNTLSNSRESARDVCDDQELDEADDGVVICETDQETDQSAGQAEVGVDGLTGTRGPRIYCTSLTATILCFPLTDIRWTFCAIYDWLVFGVVCVQRSLDVEAGAVEIPQRSLVPVTSMNSSKTVFWSLVRALTAVVIERGVTYHKRAKLAETNLSDAQAVATEATAEAENKTQAHELALSQLQELQTEVGNAAREPVRGRTKENHSDAQQVLWGESSEFRGYV
jgi:hypothetical protein